MSFTNHRFLKHACLALFLAPIFVPSFAYADGADKDSRSARQYMIDAIDYLTDATITTRIRAAFLMDQDLRSTKIAVETTHGTVNLSGDVSTPGVDSEAIRVTTQVPGVRMVNNLIAVNASRPSVANQTTPDELKPNAMTPSDSTPNEMMPSAPNNTPAPAQATTTQPD